MSSAKCSAPSASVACHTHTRPLALSTLQLTQANCFRIGNIGRLYPTDMHALVRAVKEVLELQKVPLPVTQIVV